MSPAVPVPELPSAPVNLVVEPISKQIDLIEVVPPPTTVDTVEADDIVRLRPFNDPSTWGIAVYARSRQFKLFPNRGTGLHALDFSRYFSRDANAHQSNWLKGIARYFTNKDLLSLCGGLPSSDYFPFPSMQIDFKEPRTGSHGHGKLENNVDPADGGTIFEMATGLNYGQGSGSSQMLRFVTEHTEFIHQPKYSDWACTMTIGTTSATDILLRLFCNPGDSVLVEQYGFPAAFQAVRSQQLHPVGILMDGQGIIPSSLDGIMANWPSHDSTRPRPKVLYIVPSGQNPTGATMGLQRRKEVYALAQKHDLVVLEDEPYYFLQMDSPGSTVDPAEQSDKQDRRTTQRRFLNKLAPSLLSLDTDGRVIRMDSFSKVVAPGSRCGWITAPEHVVEQYQKYSDLATQGPAGWSQIILFQLLDEGWGHDGYLDWLIHLREEYTNRRQVILDACKTHLPTEGGLISWVTPQAGMFLWLTVDASQHPSRQTANPKTTAEIETEIFDVSRETHNVLVLRGSYFLADDAPGQQPLTAAHPDQICIRLTYASQPADLIWESVRRLGAAFDEIFNVV